MLYDDDSVDFPALMECSKQIKTWFWNSYFEPLRYFLQTVIDWISIINKVKSSHLFAVLTSGFKSANIY